MGCISPVPGVGEDVVADIVARVHKPVINELARRGTPFRGCLYAGLILTADGPRVIEFNTRFGDPEAQVILPRMAADLLDLLVRAAGGSLAGCDAEVAEAACVSVVVAARGYPEAPELGDPIAGIDEAEELDGVTVFHAGTTEADGGPRDRRRPGAERDRRRPRLPRRPAAGLRRSRRHPHRRLPPPHRHRPGGAERGATCMSEQPVPAPEVRHLWAELEGDGPQVGILMGSESDREVMEAAATELAARAITFEMQALSAHRDPRGVAEYASTAALRGVRVIIAGAGKAAALPGVVAAYTELPVIGVPIRTSDLGGMDSLLSIVQMPPGVPVACMAINGARNAAIFAAKILSQGQPAPPPTAEF